MPADPQLTTMRYPHPVVEHVEIPERYRVREDDGFLICTEAPTLRVLVERGGTVSASDMRNAPEGSIFVDGAAQGAPLVDVEAAIINLDHHEACVRPFTLSSCEQALVLVAKGFDFQARDWKVHANEPDLDTLLALWVLLNHRRIQTGPTHVMERILPLVRLEGAIDVHGLEHRSLCGLPQDHLDEAMEKLEKVRELEVRLKKLEEWSTANWDEYVCDRLSVVDRLVYRTSDFLGHTDIEEIARAELSDQGLAIACRSEAEIYVVEEKLRDLYGDRLAVVLLEKTSGVYTLRQAQSFSRYSLDRAYERLNHLDPAAGNSRSSHRWGGSSDIGGSPRGVPTGLGVDEILAACRHVSAPLRRGPIVSGSLLLLATVLATCSVATAASVVASRWLPSSWSIALASTLMAILAVALYGRQSGWNAAPVGVTWLFALPVVILGAAGGGSWAQQSADPSWLVITSALVFAVAAELLFRGFCFGSLAQLVAGHASWRRAPWLVSAGLYALATWSLWAWLPGWQGAHWLPDLPSGLMTACVVLSALIFAGAMGWIRDAAESVVPGLLVHLALAVALTAW